MCVCSHCLQRKTHQDQKWLHRSTMMLANTLPGVFMSLSNHTHPHDTIARGVLSKSVVCRPSCKLVASRARHPRHGILRVHASQDIDRNYRYVAVVNYVPHPHQHTPSTHPHQHTSKTAEKALEVNLNPMFYGVLAEIGAGQEVARWFFQVGAAAGTVAKAISAYDMQVWVCGCGCGWVGVGGWVGV